MADAIPPEVISWLQNKKPGTYSNYATGSLVDYTVNQDGTISRAAPAAPTPSQPSTPTPTDMNPGAIPFAPPNAGDIPPEVRSWLQGKKPGTYENSSSGSPVNYTVNGDGTFSKGNAVSNPTAAPGAGTNLPDPKNTQGVSTTPFGRFASAFGGTGYEDSSALKQIIQEFGAAKQGGSGYLGTDAVADQFSGMIKGMIDNFRSQYSNATGGTQPSSDAVNTFIQNTLVPMQMAHSDANPTQIQAWQSQSDNKIKDLLSSTFSNDIQNANTQRLTDAATKATAPNSAFDVWQNAYRGSIDTTKKSLLDYQDKLFQKLQPNLITSLQAKGLLDTGALNTAFAGAAKDLSEANQGYISDITGRAEQDIANQRYNIMNSPNASAISNWSSQIPNLTQTGQTALQNAFNYDTSLNAQNMGNMWNKSLMDQQYANRPSPLSQYGGLLVGGIAGGIGQRLAAGGK